VIALPCLLYSMDLTVLNLAIPGSPIVQKGFPDGEVRDACGGPHHAPRSIDIDQVVEHSLRHLSWLAADDTVIRDALGPE